MKQRSMLVGYYPPRRNTDNVVREPVNIDRFEAMKSTVVTNPEAYQRYLNAIMSRIG